MKSLEGKTPLADACESYLKEVSEGLVLA